MKRFKKSKNIENRIVRVVDKGSREIIKKVRESKNLKKDEDFYLECFNQSDHRCEECGSLLPQEFRDIDDRVIARYRYSHVIPKSIAPELRHKIENINHLCLECHSKWEHGNKASMNIFIKNLKNFPNYLSKFID